jgi:hypothetical protein
VGKTDINLMSVQIGRKKVVRLPLPKHKDGMVRQNMIRVEYP